MSSALAEALAFGKALDTSGFWAAHPQPPPRPSAALQQDRQRLLQAWLRRGVVCEVRAHDAEGEQGGPRAAARYVPDVYPRLLAVLDEHHVRSFLRFFTARCRRAGIEWARPLATLADVADAADDAKLMTAFLICMRHYFI